MAYTLKLDHPDFPKGMPFDLDGILVENGSEVEVTEEMEQFFISKNQKSIKDIYGHSKIVTVSGRAAISGKKADALIIPEGADVIEVELEDGNIVAVPDPDDNNDDDTEGGEN